ncbi:hypothetical protein V5F77_15160 [Xanthobacter sp. DSM 24535]|uniref:hypothetical protein n=1 Tax=Roseixanthobacter psychrophilus TaxID=3119917 RepID=UPI00372B47C9
MSGLLDWIAYQLPWWVLAIPALVAVLAVARLAGLRAAVTVGLAAAAILIGRRGAQQGWAAREAKGERDAQTAIERARDARAAALRRDGVAERLRDDDGWRRD